MKARRAGRIAAAGLFLCRATGAGAVELVVNLGGDDALDRSHTGALAFGL